MKNGKVIKRVVSSVMALAVALTMCMVATPMRVLANHGNIFIYEDGTVSNDAGLTGHGSHIGSGDGLDVADPATVISYDGNKTVKIIGVNITNDFGVPDEFIIEVTGTNSIHQLDNTNTKVNIRMNPGATLVIDNYDAVKNNITIISGEYKDGKIVSTSEIKVGDEVEDISAKAGTSPTYKVTNTDEGKRAVTYEKPAENASGSEEIKAEVTLADSKVYKVTAIAESAFASFGGKDKITEIKIGDNVEEIGANACKDCTKLTTVTFGANVKNIGANAFSGCTALKNANLNGNVETIGASAFEKTKITKVTLGKKVKKVGKKAYYKCGSLKIVTVKSTKLTKKSKVGKNAFGKINKKAKIKIKMSKKDANKYKSNTIKVFKNKSIGYVNTWKVS